MGEEDVKQFCETFGLNFYQSIKNLTKGLKKREHMEVYENIGGGTIDLLEKLDSKKDERAWVIEIELPNIPGKEAEFREQIFGQEINVDKNETLPFGDNGSSLVTLEVSFSTEGEHALTRKDFMKRILRAKLDGYKITAKPIRG